MNILILTKFKQDFYNKSQKDVSDYIKGDHFFDGYNEGFKSLGHTTFLNWSESFFLPIQLAQKNYFLYRVLRFLIKKIGLKNLDRRLFSRKVAKFCKTNNIDMIFTEINNHISPKIIKEAATGLLVTQWYGIFPEMSDEDTLKMLSEYDIIWGPCEFHRDKVNFDGIDKLKYLGSAINPKLCYHDFDEKFAHDVVFVGSVAKAHSERIEILECIAKEIDNFAFYGYGIEDVPDDYALKKKFKGWINPVEMRKLLSSSKIALNLTLNNYDRVKEGFNARLFEIASCNGAIQILKEDKKIKEFFDCNKDLVTFGSNKELIEKIKYFLKHENERREIANNAYKKSSNFSYAVRAEQLIAHVQNMRDGTSR